MLEIRTILTPVDFSERSTAAAEHAAVLAKHFGSNLMLVHVVPEWPQGYEKEARKERADAERAMQSLIEKLKPDMAAETLIVEGDPAKKVEEFVQERSVHLLVMPTHGYGTFRRLLLGSVTTKILHDVSCPVFTGVHVSELAPFNTEPYKRVACALDLKENSESVLRWAAAFAQSWEADLLAIHAAPPLIVGGTYGDWFPPDTKEHLIQTAEKELRSLLDRVGAKAEVHVESDEPGRYVPRVADEAWADVLVIGRSAHDGLLGRLRTHSHALIRQSPCPVISI